MRDKTEFLDELGDLEGEHRHLDSALTGLDPNADNFSEAVTRFLDDLSTHIEREELGVFPVSVVTLGVDGWDVVERSRRESPSFLLDPRTPEPEMSTMQQESLTALASQHLEIARTASSGRSAHTLHGGHDHVLRQTLIALRAGTRLEEHESSGEATLQVVHGRVTLVAGDQRADGATGDLVPIPDTRHSLEAADDSAILLTVAKRV